MNGSETTPGHDPQDEGDNGGTGSSTAALVQAALAGVAGVYVATKSIVITLLAIAAPVILVALVVRRR